MYLLAPPMSATENTPFSCTVYLLSILSLPSANSQEVFPVHGVLFYLPSHGHGVALNA